MRRRKKNWSLNSRRLIFKKGIIPLPTDSILLFTAAWAALPLIVISYLSLSFPCISVISPKYSATSTPTVTSVLPAVCTSQSLLRGHSAYIHNGPCGCCCSCGQRKIEQARRRQRPSSARKGKSHRKEMAKFF